MEYQILIAIVGVLLVVGLACLWVSVGNMARLDTTPAILEKRAQGPQEEKEQVTRLGRPIREVKF
jgi:hypothetical protein